MILLSLIWLSQFRCWKKIWISILQSNKGFCLCVPYPKHTGLFATLFIPGWGKFALSLYRDNFYFMKNPSKMSLSTIKLQSLFLKFLILNNFCFMKNPSKMPLSTLKLHFLFLQFSTQDTLMFLHAPLIIFRPNQIARVFIIIM